MAKTDDQDSSGRLGEFIRAQRRLAELSQRELARLADVSDTYVSQLERGLHQPTIKVLRSIASALDIRADTMMRHAGWREAQTGESATTEGVVEAAIRVDPALSNQQKEALLAVYRGFVESDD